jgi:hypothetical protein
MCRQSIFRVMPMIMRVFLTDRDDGQPSPRDQVITFVEAARVLEKPLRSFYRDERAKLRAVRLVPMRIGVRLADVQALKAAQGA